MSIVASGQITLVDLNDSRQLVSYIGASRAKTVIHNPNDNTYVPNYETSNQVLTPQLFIAGTNTDVASQAKSTKWFRQTNSAGTPVEITASGGGYTLGTGAVKTLTITSNVLASATTMTYICEMVFTDADTGFDVLTKAEIELVKVTNGQKGSDGEKGADGEDGRDGVDSVVAMVWTPEGNTLKNSEGTLKASVTLYKGTTEVTPTAFKWYYQDPSATTSSGGDADGGNGWRLMKDVASSKGVTGYTTATITIPASAIEGVESFKCIATYDGNKYRDVCTVIDVTDPIVVTIVGLSTFKNGQGSTELTAKLYRNGAEVDTAGTEYNYSWSIYNSSNQKTAFSKTGKTITVSADDIDVRGNVVCEVSNK